MELHVIKDNGDWRDLDVLLPNGKLRLMPSAYWHALPFETRRTFLHYRAQYFIPTVEAMEYLSTLISDVPKEACLEIGAGNGWLGYHLGIRMTDSWLQTMPEVRLNYQMMKQPTIDYGSDVEKIDAVAAVEKYKPDTVVASWVTQLGNPPNGNPYGIDELELMKHCRRYILIGTDAQHGNKIVVKRKKFTKHRFDWLVSRSQNQPDNAVWIFEN